MSDYSRRVMQEIQLGADEAPIIIPPAMSAQALHSNRFSIVGVLVNPGKQSMNRLITQMPCFWGLTDVVIGRKIDSRMFQFVFPTEEAVTSVMDKGPWSFSDWMIVSKRWDATVTEEDLKMIPFWVQIKGIPPHYLSRAVIEFIGETCGEVMDVEFEDRRSIMDHVWVLVNWNIDNPLLFKRRCQFAVGEIAMLSFQYDGLANFCSLCGMLTHDETQCPLYSEDDGNQRRDYGNAGAATGPVIDERQQILSKAFTGKGLCAGPSGEVSIPYSYIPPIDCDKLAETLRYLKAKLGKGKLPMRDNWGPTESGAEPSNCMGNSHYDPISGWNVCERTEPVYAPMETGVCDDLNEEFIVAKRTKGGVCGVKRERKEYAEDSSIVHLSPGRKKGKLESGDSGKMRKPPYSDCVAGQVEDCGTLWNKVVMNTKLKLEDCESVDSSE